MAGKRERCAGFAIRRFREQAGWTQQELAFVAKYSKRLICEMEDGQSARYEDIENIAGTLQKKLRDSRGPSFHLPVAALLLCTYDPIHVLPQLPETPFVGRETLFKRLTGFLVNAETPPHVIVLTGPTDVGKTEAVLRYAHRHAGRFRIIWWLRVGDPMDQRKLCARLCGSLATPHSDPFQCLRKHDDWLLIFDGAHSTRNMLRLLPRNHNGNVIITTEAGSEHTNWRRLGAVLPVGPLSEPEAEELLIQRGGGMESDRPAAREIAVAVGFLPGLLCEVADHISGTGKSFEQMSRTTREIGTGSGQFLVAALHADSVERLGQESSDGALLLSLLAFFSSENFPLELLHRSDVSLPERIAAIVRDPDRFERALEDISRLNRARLADKTISVLPDTQKAAYALLDESERKELASAALNITSAALPLEADAEPEITGNRPNWIDRQQVLPHALSALRHARRLKTARPSDWFRIRLTEAISNDMTGQFVRAERICRSIVRYAGSVDVAMVASARVQLAAMYDHLGRQAEAFRVLAPIVDEGAAKHGPRFYWAIYQQAVNLMGQGRYSEASRLLNFLLTHRSETSHAIAAVHQLAIIDLVGEHYIDAEHKLRQCLDHYSDRPDSHRKAYAHRRLGQVFAQTDRMEEAAAEFRKALSIASRFRFNRYVAVIEADMRRYGILPLASGESGNREEAG